LLYITRVSDHETKTEMQSSQMKMSKKKMQR